MKNVFFSLLAVIIFAGTANAAVLTFDEFSGVSTINLIEQIPNYGGYTWGGDWELTSNSYYRTKYANSFNFPSNDKAIYNGYDFDGGTSGGGFDVPLTISSDTAFTLESAYFAAWTSYNTNAYWAATSLTINAYSDDSLVNSKIIDLLAGQLQLYTIGLTGDKFEFVQTAGANPGQDQWWLMDNLTTSATPIPGAVWLLGTGIVGLFGLRKKFQS